MPEVIGSNQNIIGGHGNAWALQAKKNLKNRLSRKTPKKIF